MNKYRMTVRVIDYQLLDLQYCSQLKLSMHCVQELYIRMNKIAKIKLLR